MKAYAAFSSLFLFAAACTTQPDQQGTQDSGSSLNSIDLKLPSKDGLAPEVAEKLTEYRMTITAIDPKTFPLAPADTTTPSFDVCRNIPVSSTNNGSTVVEVVKDGLERVGKYVSSDAIAAKIRSGCHYTVKLEVGNEAIVAQALRDEKGFDTYYVGEAYVNGSSDNAAYASDGKIHVQITMNLAKDKAASGENLPGSLIPADKDLEIEAKFGNGVDGQGVAALR